MAPAASQAADSIKFTPQVDIGTEFSGEQTINGNSIGNYIKIIYKYAIGIVGILAAVILMIAGVIWLTAGGNASQITEAKAWITASLTGLILALCSYLILATVNPVLVEFKSLEITDIANIKLTINADTGIKEVKKEMIAEHASPAVIKATIEAIETSSTRCCFYKKDKKCVDDVRKEDCVDNKKMKAYQGLCKYVIDCPQYCARAIIKAGTNCSNSYLNPAVCTAIIDGKNRCEKCNKKEGQNCINSTCCAGLCCGKIKSKGPLICIKGTPTRGSSCN